jgi:hypothetical protein
MQMTRALNVLKMILVTGSASAFLMQAPCTWTDNTTRGGLSIIPIVFDMAAYLNGLIHGTGT